MRTAMQPHVSVAAVALHYRLNANLVRSWITRQAKRQGGKQTSQSTDVSPAEFVPLQLAAPSGAAPASQAIFGISPLTPSFGKIQWPLRLLFQTTLSHLWCSRRGLWWGRHQRTLSIARLLSSSEDRYCADETSALQASHRI